jgi:hypothetical protein
MEVPTYEELLKNHYAQKAQEAQQVKPVERQATARFLVQGSPLGEDPISLVGVISSQNNLKWKLLFKQGWIFPTYRFEIVGAESDVRRAIEEFKQHEC